MKSLMIFTFSLSLLGAPVSAARLAEPAIQVHARAQYQGGWPLALMASETAGCPVEAPVQCQNNYTTLECCPGSQVCHIDATSEEQYCCPTEDDCYTAALNYPVCANSSWILYSANPTFFCCEPGYTASLRVENGYGYCEPAGVIVPSALLAPTISQDTVPVSTPSSTAAISTSETTETMMSTTGTMTATVLTNTTISTSVARATHTSLTPSVKTNATITTPSITGNPTTSSTSSSASGSASTSTHSGTSISASYNPVAMGAVVALCFGVGFFGLIS